MSKLLILNNEIHSKQKSVPEVADVCNKTGLMLLGVHILRCSFFACATVTLIQILPTKQTDKHADVARNRFGNMCHKKPS